MLTLEMIKHIQILALQAIEAPDYNAFYRKICRWYSEKYATPLKQMEDLDELHVLQTYFEANYGALHDSQDKEDNQRYDEIRNAILLTPEEQQRTSEEDEDWAAKMAADVAASQSKQSKAGQIPVNPNLIEEKTVQGETVIPNLTDIEN